MAKYVILYIMISIFSENFKPKKDQKKIHIKLEIVNIGKVLALFCDVDQILYIHYYMTCVNVIKVKVTRTRRITSGAMFFLSLATELDCV